MTPLNAPKNPYIFGPPVGNTPAFVEREDIFLFVVHALQDEKQDAVCLFGQRRIGKTSVLQYLHTCLPQKISCETILFDLQGKADLPLARILLNLSQSIANKLEVLPLNSSKNIVEEFSTEFLPSVLNMLPAEQSLVLMFDEFDTLTDINTDQAESSLFIYLRNLITQFPGKLKFIFVLGRHISDLTTRALVLFKNTKFKHISLLPKVSTINLIKLAEKNGSLHWDQKAIERVWDLTHGHSLFTQAICSTVWEQAYLDEPEDIPSIHAEDVDNAIQDVLGSCSNMMLWLWGGLAQSEQIVAAAIAELGKAPISMSEIAERVHKHDVRILIRDLKDAPHMLQDSDLIEPGTDGGYCYRVELVRIWVQKEWPLSRVQKIMDRNQPIVENLYSAARGLLEEKKVDEAVVTLQQALALNPRHSQSCELLADLYLKEKKLWEARLLLEPVSSILPAIACPRLVEIYLEQAAYEKDEEERLNLYAQVSKLDPGNQEAVSETREIYACRADENYRKNNLSQALNEFIRAGDEKKAAEITQIITEQEDLANRFRKGLTAFQKKEYNTAQSYFYQIIKKYENYEFEGLRAADLYEQSRLAARSRKEKWSEWAHQPWNRFWLIAYTILFIFIITISFFTRLQVPILISNFKAAPATSTPQLPVTIDTPLPSSGSPITVENASRVIPWARWDVSEILGLAFSSDGNRLAAGSYNSTVMIWNVQSGKLANALAGHTSWVRTVAFSPNKKILASGSDDGTIRLWNINDGSMIRSLKGDAGIISSIAFSPNQIILASGTGNGTIELWEVSSGKLIRTLKGHRGSVRSVAFTPNETWLVSGSEDKTVKMWSWQYDGGSLQTLNGHSDAVTSIAISNDSKWIASGSKDHTIRLWNANDGKNSRVLINTSGNGVYSLDFSQDNGLLAAGEEGGNITLWNASNGSQLMVLTGHTKAIRSLTFSPDGKILASSGEDKIFLWAIPR